MKKMIWASSLLFLQFSFLAQAQTPAFICQLSISSPSGSSSLCNAVHIGKGRLLSASHCFPEGKKTIQSGIILATCGDEEFMEFSHLKRSPEAAKGVVGEDIALLEFSPQINADWVVPTAYPAMYFDGPKIKSSVDCEVLSLRGDYPSKRLRRFKIDQKMDLRMLSNSGGLPSQLVMTFKSRAAFEESTSVREGDSGGALVCRAYKTARPELVGIIMTYGTDRVTKKIMQNTFSPVFGPEAGKLLNK
jgi:hypothetical protein